MEHILAEIKLALSVLIPWGIQIILHMIALIVIIAMICHTYNGIKRDDKASAKALRQIKKIIFE